MQVSTKELRIQPGKIINQVVHGNEVTVTYRGKALAKIVPIKNEQIEQFSQDSIFGLWKNHENQSEVNELIREIRKGRQF